MINFTRLPGQINNILLSLLILFNFIPPLFAEPKQVLVDRQIKFQEIKFDMTVPNASANLMQDRDGFFWFGAQGTGLTKWNGMTMKHYNTENSEISDSFVNAIIEDKKGLLWIGTSKGLNIYDKTSNSFTSYTHDPQNPASLSTDNIGYLYYKQALCEDVDGFIWIATESGLNKFNPKTATFTRYTHNPDQTDSINHNIVYAVYEDSESNLWIGTKNGLNLFNKDKQTFTSYKHDPETHESLSHNEVYAILEDKKGNLWLGTGDGLNKFDKTTKKFKRYQYQENNPNSMANKMISLIIEDRFGELWLAHYPAGKVSKFNPVTETFITFQHDTEIPGSLPGNDIKNIYEDQTGIIWVTTNTSKFAKYDNNALKFTLYQKISKAKHSFNGIASYAVTEDQDGYFWITTDKIRLNKYNKKTNTFTSIEVKGKTPYSISSTPDGTIWIGETTGTLNIFDRKTERYTKSYQITNSFISHIVQDNHDPNILWLTTNTDGLVKFHKKSGKAFYYKHDDQDQESIKHNSVWAIFQEDNTLWLGTAGGGLNKFNKKTGKFIAYMHDENDPTSIGGNVVGKIIRTSSGELWFGLLGAGINKFNEKTGKFKRFTQADGSFCADMVVGLLEDKEGNFWLPGWVDSTTWYIKFDPQKLTWKMYGPGDGVQQGPFWYVGLYQAKDGQFWFSGGNGLNTFYPEQVKDNQFIPPVYLTSLKQGGEELKLTSALEKIDQLDFHRKNNFFEFEYIALNYTHPEQNKYKYMLEGYDKDWFDAGKKRFGRYSNIQPGEYTLKVIGSNNDGIWNNKGAAVSIIVHPDWWQTWWFKGGLLILIISLIAWNIRLRINRIEKQRNQLELQVDLRTKELSESNKQLALAKEKSEVANQAKSEFLSNMSHELRTPLNGILGYTQILKRNKTLSRLQEDSLNIIHRSGEHLLTLINDILDLSKIEARKLELYPVDINLPEFLQEIAEIIRMRAEQKNISFVYEALSDLPGGVKADEKRLRQILLNLLGNAVKFTDSGRVTFHVKSLPVKIANSNSSVCKFRFEINDTGPGISQEKLKKIFLPFEQLGNAQQRAAGTGLGLAISRQLVSLMNGEIQVKSELNKGSNFWFEIKLPVVDVEFESKEETEQIITGYKGQRRKVLVVDDKSYNRSFLIDVLNPLGFECFEADNGRTEIEKAIEIQPDIILTDLIMPVMTGFEAVQEIRKIPELKNVIIIAITASVFNMTQKQSKLAGCDAFLSKPVEIKQLTDYLKTFLKIDWIYEEPFIEDITAEELKGQLIPPPQDELEKLLELALMGNMFQLQEQALELEKANPQYKTFARKLYQLAKNFQDKQLPDFIKSYLENLK